MLLPFSSTVSNLDTILEWTLIVPDSRPCSISELFTNILQPCLSDMAVEINNKYLNHILTRNYDWFPIRGLRMLLVDIIKTLASNCASKLNGI